MIKFIKENKWKFIISNLLLLIPVLIGIILWDKLPENIVTHFGADSVADGTSTKAFTVFVLPIIFIPLHWLALGLTVIDNKSKEQSKKVFNILFWILPFISIMTNAFIYSTALGQKFNLFMVIVLAIGLLFVIIGNYLPKVKQNSTLGIKIKWTLENEKNWNATHRFGGKVWVVGGLILVAAAFLPPNIGAILSVIDFVLLIAVPTIYSAIYAKFQKQSGEYIAVKHKSSSIAFVLAVIILLAVGILMFTGEISYEFSDTGFNINADYYTDISVDFDMIDSIKYSEAIESGYRINGFGSAKLSMGIFQNSEFGSYTRYCYTGNKSGIVLVSGDEILVINAKTPEMTLDLYNTIAAKTAK